MKSLKEEEATVNPRRQGDTASVIASFQPATLCQKSSGGLAPRTQTDAEEPHRMSKPFHFSSVTHIQRQADTERNRELSNSSTS